MVEIYQYYSKSPICGIGGKKKQRQILTLIKPDKQQLKNKTEMHYSPGPSHWLYFNEKNSSNVQKINKVSQTFNVCLSSGCSSPGKCVNVTSNPKSYVTYMCWKLWNFVR